MLKDKGIRQNMSRKDNCLDNTCAENFFRLLKTEFLYLQEFDSVEHFIAELHAYIEWYNIKPKLVACLILNIGSRLHKNRSRFLLVALHKFLYKTLSNFLRSIQVHSILVFLYVSYASTIETEEVCEYDLPFCHTP